MEKIDIKHNDCECSVARAKRMADEIRAIVFEHVIKTAEDAEHLLERVVVVVFPAEHAERGLRNTVRLIAVAVVVENSHELHERFFTHDILPKFVK